MPELPEVETTRLGLLPLCQGQIISAVQIIQPKLRWSIPNELQALCGRRLIDIERRGKYLIFQFDIGQMILHLGLSGHLKFVSCQQKKQKHDHFELVFNTKCLRLHDPRRFSSVRWQPNGQTEMLNLGIEPLSKKFNGAYLYRISRNRRSNIKSLLLDQKQIAGIGNIYAAEALFHAGILPQKIASELNREACDRLTRSIKLILKQAIAAGGTSLKDFQQIDGRLGYFKQKLQVYGRQDRPCKQCGQILRRIKLQGRNTVYCPKCQH